MTHTEALRQRLADEADLCRIDGADDIAALLDKAAAGLAQPVPDAAVYAATSERTAPNWHAGFRAGMDAGKVCAAAAHHQPAPDAIHWPQVVAYPGGNGGLGAWVDISTGDGPEHVQRFHAAAHPQPAPLTDAQIKAALTVAVQSGAVSWLGFEKDEDGRYTVPSLSPQHYQIARAIEAAHGIVPAPTTDTKEQP